MAFFSSSESLPSPSLSYFLSISALRASWRAFISSMRLAASGWSLSHSSCMAFLSSLESLPSPSLSNFFRMAAFLASWAFLTSAWRTAISSSESLPSLSVSYLAMTSSSPMIMMPGSILLIWRLARSGPGPWRSLPPARWRGPPLLSGGGCISGASEGASGAGGGGAS